MANSDNKKEPFCKHGFHVAIRCLQCERESIAKLKEKQAYNDAAQRVMEKAKRLDW
tara:strand:+ start:3426 stop:3593 length:168 start_codon:yes stop_codon:yes gene_type:complete